jgi:hypothetical protein
MMTTDTIPVSIRTYVYVFADNGEIQGGTLIISRRAYFETGSVVVFVN